MLKASVSIDSQHISSILKLNVFFLTYSVVLTMNHWNEKLSLHLPGFAAYVFHKRLWLITATHSNLSFYALLPRTYLHLIIICGIVTSILLFSYTIFGFPYVVDFSYHVPCVLDLSHQKNYYFIEGTSSAQGHYVI